MFRPVKRMAKNAFSTADDRIQEYCNTFDKLKEAFDKKLQVETRIVVTKVLSAVDGLSMSRVSVMPPLLTHTIAQVRKSTSATCCMPMAPLCALP